MKARQAALHTIDGVINQHRTLNTLLAQDKSRVSAADQALYQRSSMAPCANTARCPPSARK